MSIGKIIAGLDIGSSKIRLAVGQRIEEDKRLNIIAAVETSAQGINKGVVTSIDDAVAAISDLITRAEKVCGVPIERVWLGVSGSHIISQASKGVVAISRSDGEITEEDVDRVIDAARAVATPSNYEILHVIPRSFTIDDQSNIKDPVGMTGIRLEVEAQIIQGLVSQIKNLTKSVYRTGLDIEDAVLSVLACSEAVLTSRQKELGVVLINIGAATTSFIVFEEGDVIYTAVLPIGSDHITADLAIGLRVSIDVAEKIKLEYGAANSKDINKKDEIDLSEIDSSLKSEEAMVPRKYVVEIIEARVEEILERVDKELKKVDRSGNLPAGAVLVGGGAKIPRLVEVAKSKLRLPACIGVAQNVVSAIDKVQDISFTTAIGLIVWGNQLAKEGKGGFSVSRFKSVAGVMDKMRSWVKNLIP